MESPVLVPVFVAIITGVFAVILSSIALLERRADKRALIRKAEKEAELEKIKEESTKHIKEIADEIAAQYQHRVDDLEKEVDNLKKRLACLEDELAKAYTEIKRLKSLLASKGRKTETNNDGG